MKKKDQSWKTPASSNSSIISRVVVFFLLLLLLLLSDHQSDARQLLQQTNGTTADAAALLSFKTSSVVSDPNGYLSSWTDAGDACMWRGVSCGSDGRVQTLDLSGFGLAGKLHLPHLAALPALRSLNLRANRFSSGDLSAPSSCVLESIDLSSNNFSDKLPPKSFLESCDGLRYLNLSDNSITGGSLSFGPALLQLDLSRNQVSDPAFLSYSLSSCKNLNHLNFSGNKISGEVLAGHVSCPSLSVLDISKNNLSGSFSGVAFTSCANLTVLNLSYNLLTVAEFPTSLRNCRLLQTLDMSHNALQSKIPGTLLGSFQNLRKLSLAHNLFIGQVPNELGQLCGTLQELDLSGNNLSGGLPSELASCSSLWSLNVGNNFFSGDFLSTVVSRITGLRYLYASFNNVTGPVPTSLTNCSQLRVIDLSSNGFTGAIPSFFCSSSSFPSLEKLLLANNYLSGTVPPELGNCENLRSIDFSFNDLHGEIPQQVWNLPKLSDLVMWANNLSGEIPQGICVNGGNLEMLVLNNNFISGKIPQSIGKCTNMIWVSLSSNRLTGEIPAGIGNLPKLAILQLGNNSLTGRVPPELGKCSGLIWLDLNSNELSGPLPPELADQAGRVSPGSVSGKQFAFVRNEGGTACRGAGGLVEFEGIRPSRLESFPMVHSCPSTRIYTGLTVYTFASNGTMIYLDLSYNSISGTIPEKYGVMSFLQVLNLGHNGLSGNIPETFGALKLIGVLDLSYNHLQGSIPGSLGALSFLSDMDVSNNNLSGPIPSGGQLMTFPSSRFENNSGLCGVPLPKCGSGPSQRATSSYSGKSTKRAFEAGMVTGISFFVACILGLTLALYRAKENQKTSQMREKYIESLPTSGSSSWKLSSVHEPLSINVATFEKPLRKLTFAHLLEATNGFSSDTLIGKGGFGEVYKAQLRDGPIVAIKKLIHTGQGDREFMAEMETIGKIKHRNLVPLLGYCKIGEERLLVYEYMKWGSLESVLHDRAENGLDWPARKKIAVGAARGLAFLHHSCIPHIIHRDMKSSNVLLDENFEARVSDFGMARLVNALDTHLSVSTLAGTPGYVPPEYYQSFRCTAKGDVYSFGVILLELVSGKRPIDSREFGEDNNLVSWAKQLHREKRIDEILDPKLLTSKSTKLELYHYLRIAFESLDDRPFKRPTMIQVMTMFKELQVDSESDVLDGLSVKDSLIDE